MIRHIVLSVFVTFPKQERPIARLRAARHYHHINQLVRPESRTTDQTHHQSFVSTNRFDVCRHSFTCPHHLVSLKRPHDLNTKSLHLLLPQNGLFSRSPLVPSSVRLMVVLTTPADRGLRPADGASDPLDSVLHTVDTVMPFEGLSAALWSGGSCSGWLRAKRLPQREATEESDREGSPIDPNKPCSYLCGLCQ